MKFFIAIAILVAAESTAFAADSASSKMREGKLLFKESRFEEARVKFAEACATARTESCIQSLAFAEFYSEHYEDAAVHFKEILDSPKAELLDRKTLNTLRERLKSAEKHIENRAAESKSTKAEAPISIVVEKRSEPEKPHVLKPIASNRTTRWIAAGSLAGAAAVGLVVSRFLSAESTAKTRDAQSLVDASSNRCATVTPTCDQAAESLRDAQTKGTWATAFVVGSAIAGIGASAAAVWALWPDAITPQLSPTMAGADLKVHF